MGSFVLFLVIKKKLQKMAKKEKTYIDRLHFKIHTSSNGFAHKQVSGLQKVNSVSLKAPI